jgi:NTE family protein
MAKTRIAIACQGGGSQTAFTAGALKGLIEAPERDSFEVVSLSGTSGGAVCAAMVWYAAMKGEPVRWRRLIDFWKDNTAQNWLESNFNEFIVRYLRSVNAGLFPAYQMSPSSPIIKSMMAGVSAFMPRKEYMDFAALLEKYIDFAEIASWGARPQAPVLVVGAANITTGSLAKFSSAQEPIRLEHILASCCVPSIFPAVMIDGHAYWDGLFSDNPPIQELIRPRTVGLENLPDEIWLIKINPTGRKQTPAKFDEITDRHNQLQGNISLFQQLDHLELINDLIVAGAFRPEFLEQLEVKAPIRIPKPFAGSPDKPYHIPYIEMPEAVQETLDYEGKIDRSSANIDGLIALGEAAAREFLVRRAAAVAASKDQAGTMATAELRNYMWRHSAPRTADRPGAA